MPATLKPVSEMAQAPVIKQTEAPTTSPTTGKAAPRGNASQWVFFVLIAVLWALAYIPGPVGRFLQNFSAILFP